MIEQSARFVCIRVDTSEDKDTTDKYGIEAVPTLLFVRSNGDVIAECKTADPEAMARQMAEVAGDYKEE